MISPRGLYPSQAGGFSWSARTEPGWSGIEDFRPAGQALIDFVTIKRFPQADLNKVILIGFSQGAALAFSMLLLFPERIYTIAAISGFLPSGSEHYLQPDQLKGKMIFVAHGKNDGIVPIEASKDAVESLEKTGVQVAYCEEDVGHKLSANCFRSLDTFIDSIL